MFPLVRFDLGRPIPSRPRTAAEQVRPDGFGKTCQEHQIRESVALRMARREAVVCAGLARVHSSQPSLSRSDTKNAGLVYWCFRALLQINFISYSEYKSD